MNEKVINLKRFIPAHEKNPNTNYEVVGLEEALKNGITTNGFIPLCQISLMNNVMSFMLLCAPGSQRQYEQNIIGEIFSVNDDTVSFRSTLDIHQDYTNKKVFFAYKSNNDHKTHKTIVESVSYAFILTEIPKELIGIL